MLHYKGHTVSFQEVPDEVSLVILIGDCPHRCVHCHSPDLWTQSGISVKEKLDQLIDEYADAITCVCFMGDGQDDNELFWCADHVKNRGFKTALYSGYYDAYIFGEPYFDYIKGGPYKEKRGGLDNPNTNQYMLKRIIGSDGKYTFEDITYRFQRSND